MGDLVGWNTKSGFFALAVPHPWHELNASLHVATVMSLRLGNSKACKLCWEPDHAEAQCALASLQPPQPTAGGLAAPGI